MRPRESINAARLRAAGGLRDPWWLLGTCQVLSDMTAMAWSPRPTLLTEKDALCRTPVNCTFTVVSINFGTQGLRSYSHNEQWMSLMVLLADKMLELKTEKRNGERMIFK